MDVSVEYDYLAQNPDELTINRGEIIRNVFKKEDGWMEGELNGKIGLFPDNFIKIINNSKSTTPTKQQFINDTKKQKNIFNELNNNKKSMTIGYSTIKSPEPPFKPAKKILFKAKVVYTYKPVNDDELAIQENDIVEVIRLVEDGWYEGIYNGKQGVFPSNYVVKLENDKKLVSSSGDELDGDGRKVSKKPQNGIGFGNIFSGKQIELKKTQIRAINNINDNQIITPQPPASVPPSLPVKNVSTIIVKAKVLYNYEPTQPDELQLRVGDILTILDKNLEDEGWWKGELNGKVGVFPDNFIEEIIETPPPTKSLRSTSNNNNNTTSSSLNNESTQSKEDLNRSEVVSPNDFDDLQANKLQHLKKQPIRPQNKRPPSFRFKTRSEKVDDAESLLNQITKQEGQVNHPPASTSPGIDQEPVKLINTTNEIKQKLEGEKPLITQTQVTPSPPPNYTSPLLNNTNSNHNNIDEINTLKSEIESLKKITFQLASDYQTLQNESRLAKQSSDDNINKLQKRLKDLIDEIDDEKKTRMSLQVELERLKKTVQSMSII